MQRDPALLREAAAGRSGQMIEAMAQEARVRADPNLRADRFVERWQGLKQERDRLYRAGDMAGRERKGKAEEGRANNPEPRPPVGVVLRYLHHPPGLGTGRDVGAG